MPRTTDLQQKARRLREFYRKEKRMPGYNEMLKLFGYRSKNAVSELLDKLCEAGYITKNRGKLAPTNKLTGTIRLLGTVQAGFPSPAEEELIDVLSLDEFLVRRPESTFMLNVTGDSMIDAGIHPGDIVLVEKGCEPKTGDIVIAQVDHEWTMKYFVRDAKGVRLESANKRFRSIVPRQSLVIGGIVKSVVRRYD